MSDKIQIQIPLHKTASPNVPANREERNRLKTACRSYAHQQKLVGPLSLDKLKTHAAAILTKEKLSPQYLEFTVVVLNNEIYLSALSKVPYEKRLLLLPRCLRDDKVCKGEFDDLGLLCRACGGCAIDALTKYAGQLGYSVLVAEGSPVVMGMIEAGGIEAVVGVSCLSMLEKVFPYMEAAAFPGLAVPLLYDGCNQTAFDIDWLMEFLQWRQEDGEGRLNVGRLKQTVSDWFETDALERILGQPQGPVQTAAVQWLSLAGKRWRPALAAGLWTSVTQSNIDAIPESVQKMCIAVECFHKASLIHDDIEDGDQFRYGQKSLHAKLGIPVALNVGDYLIGLGYQILSDLNVEAGMKNRLISIAAGGHRILCMGQGAELDWLDKKNKLSVEDVLKIFEQKTVPAFDVALKLGAVMAGAEEKLLTTLEQFSRFVGLAYQIRDDLLDWQAGDRQADRLSVFRVLPNDKSAEQTLCLLLSDFRDRARNCLDEISIPNVKGFLRKILAKILDQIEDLSCCEDHTPRND